MVAPIMLEPRTTHTMKHMTKYSNVNRILFVQSPNSDQVTNLNKVVPSKINVPSIFCSSVISNFLLFLQFHLFPSILAVPSVTNVLLIPSVPSVTNVPLPGYALKLFLLFPISLLFLVLPCSFSFSRLSFLLG